MEKQKLFVGNLNFETTEDELKVLFSAHGTVKSIRLQQKKGVAFVEMSTREEAATALQHLNESNFKDRPLRIDLELPKNRARTLTKERFKDSPKKNKKKSSKKKLPADKE